jgi:hypothetical protein
VKLIRLIVRDCRERTHPNDDIFYLEVGGVWVQARCIAGWQMHLRGKVGLGPWTRTPVQA